MFCSYICSINYEIVSKYMNKAENIKQCLHPFFMEHNIRSLGVSVKSLSDRTPIAFLCAAPSVIRKNKTIEMVAAFIKANTLPATVIDDNEFSSSFQIKLN